MIGRPPLPKKYVRDRKVVICVSQVEQRSLREWARSLGKPLAVAVRDAALIHEMETREGRT